MTLGEILQKFLGAANAGAEHQFAMKTRGGDYLQKEEVLGNQEQKQALEQGLSLKEQMLKDAITKAAGMAARQGQTSTIDSEVGTPDQVQTEPASLDVPEGASDELAAAIQGQNTKGAKEAAELLLRKGQVREQNALAGRNEGYLTNEREKRASAQGIAETGADARRDVATTAAGARVGAAQIGASRPRALARFSANDPENPGQTAQFEWDPKTRSLTKIEGSSKTSGLGQRLQLGAESVDEIGNALISDLQPGSDVYDTLGPVATRLNQVASEVGVRGELASEIVGRLKSFAAAHLNLYPRGGAEMVKAMDALLETPQTPESLRGAIKGLMALSKSLALKETPPRHGAPAASGGSVIKVDAEGNPIG